MVSIILFWISIFLIVYGFLGYIVFLRAICMFINNTLINDQSKYNNEENLPELTLIISVYNEENIIEQKLNNSLSLDYPKNKLEIIVVSDGSTDKTEDKVMTFFDEGVKLLRQEPRSGKTAALNRSVPLARGEVIVFSDANSMYETSSLRNLAMHFSHSDIGFVTGRTKYVSRFDNTIAETTSIYNRLELFTKHLESRISSCVGADGAIFAIRKILFVPLQDYDINDFVIPLNIIGQGYRGILEEKATCLEETSKDILGEFNRQVRISCRSIRAIFNNAFLLNPLKFPIFSFKLISHKLIKYMLPFFLIGALITNIIILPSGFFYQIFFACQVLFYLFFIIGHFYRYKDFKFKLPKIAYTFVIINVAIFLGWIKFFSGETYTTWNSDRP